MNCKQRINQRLLLSFFCLAALHAQKTKAFGVGFVEPPHAGSTASQEVLRSADDVYSSSPSRTEACPSNSHKPVSKMATEQVGDPSPEVFMLRCVALKGSNSCCNVVAAIRRTFILFVHISCIVLAELHHDQARWRAARAGR